MKFIEAVAQRNGYEVLIPVHEQAYLFARYRHLLHTASALSDFAAFQKIQGKVAFANTLQTLSLPQPEYSILDDLVTLKEISDFPFYLKANYSTAGQGVWYIESREEFDQLLTQLISQGNPRENRFMIQKQAVGDLCQAQAIFDCGRLIALHCTQTCGSSIGGGHAARTSVDHHLIRGHFQMLGAYLNWSGPIALDYIYNTETHEPLYLEANPRLVEPMNAFLSGINFPKLNVQIALKDPVIQDHPMQGKTGVRSHSLLAILLGEANDGRSRRELLKTIFQSIERSDLFEESMEDLTPFSQDMESLLPFMVVFIRLMLNPRNAGKISRHSINFIVYTPKLLQFWITYRFLNLIIFLKIY